MTSALQSIAKSHSLECSVEEPRDVHAAGEFDSEARHHRPSSRILLSRDDIGFERKSAKSSAFGTSGRRRKGRDALKLGDRLKKPMTYENSPRRRLSLPPASEPVTQLTAQADEQAWQSIVSLLSAIDELSASNSTEALLKTAVEMARTCVGLERVGLYLADAANPRTLRGTFGTGSTGDTTDERDVVQELSEEDHRRLVEAHKEGARWLFFERADHIAQESGRSLVIGQGWLAITPLVHERDFIGVLYNDAALSHTPVDWGKQVRTAVFCSLLAGLLVARRKGNSVRPAQRETERGSVVRQVQRALNLNPLISGEQLAKELNISAGYLARVFKTEVGVSLVEYRNRLRIERFLRLVERGGGILYEAAIEAGFGSYAQFHRVFRRHVGTTPREYVTGVQTTDAPQGAEPLGGV
jgi:AraC-like DNA-binding protein